MKNLIKLLGIITLLAVIGFSFAACDTGTDPGTASGPQSATYVSHDSAGNFYMLVITENTNRQARYTARNGDSFTFIVKLYNAGVYSEALTYSGIIESAQANGTATTINITVNGKPLVITVSGTNMTVISGEIVLDIVDNAGEKITITLDDDESLTPMNTPEEWPTAIRWGKWAAEDSTATVDYSVDDDEVCTITVGGTAMADTPAWDKVWKVNASYSYTAEKGNIYAYKFEAWTDTDGDARTMNVQWYGDNDKAIYHNTGYNENQLPVFTITSERETYTITGSEPIPKSGIQNLEFQCANKTGTYYVKIISIETVVPKTITITGITGKTGNAFLQIQDDYELVAGGEGSVSGNSVSFKLKKVVKREDYYVSTDALWLGSGSYYLDLFFEGSSHLFYYSNGNQTGEPQKYNITSATSTIPFNKFVESGSIVPDLGPDATIIENFATDLSRRAPNTKDTPYDISLNISDSLDLSDPAGNIGYVLSINDDKYVNLDLSGSTFTSIGSQAFYGTNLTGITIPNSVTSIGVNAFSGCTSLTGITIPNSVTSIGVSAFSYCTSLTSVTLPANANFTSIGGWAFEGCTSLASITIPASVTTIGQMAFDGCTSLASVTIPNSVTSIEADAFSGCTSLASVTIQGTISSDNFSYHSPFPGDLRGAYLADEGGPGTYTRPDGSSETWTKK